MQTGLNQKKIVKIRYLLILKTHKKKWEFNKKKIIYQYKYLNNHKEVKIKKYQNEK